MLEKHSSPKIILVRPQMQENIGATARAMANFALHDLYLVNPRENLGDKAYALSAGATDILGCCVKIMRRSTSFELMDTAWTNEFRWFVPCGSIHCKEVKWSCCHRSAGTPTLAS